MSRKAPRDILSHNKSFYYTFFILPGQPNSINFVRPSLADSKKESRRSDSLQNQMFAHRDLGLVSLADTDVRTFGKSAGGSRRSDRRSLATASISLIRFS